jgi:hypothetical protein
MILTKEQIADKRINSKVITVDKHIMKKHNDKYDFLKAKVNTGKFFLYEITESIKAVEEGYVERLYYPKLGLHIDDYMVDMAIEVEWVDVRRTWENNTQYEYISDIDGKKYKSWADDERTELRSCICWDDAMYVYGVWDVKPTWKELKLAYQQTLWFGRTEQEIRDIKLSSILGKI